MAKRGNGFPGGGIPGNMNNLMKQAQRMQRQMEEMLCACSTAQSCLTLLHSMDCRPPGPLSTGFPRQEYWSGMPFPSPGDLPKPGIESASLASPALVGRFFIIGTTWEAQRRCSTYIQWNTPQP